VAGTVPQTMAGMFPVSAYYGVRKRRIIAYLIDLAIIFAIQVLGFLVAIVLALPTLGLTTLAFAPLAITPLVGTIYAGLTVGGRSQATIGQRGMGLIVARDNGEKIDFVLAACQAVLFYVSIVALTPLVLVVSLLDSRKRLLHDLVLGLEVRRAAP